MANLKEIRLRIASVSTTRQITSAMKMVSAAKLKKAQDAVLQLRPYTSKLNDILSNLHSLNEGGDDSLFFKSRAENNILIVLITSNRGLCGSFNSNVIKMGINLALNEYSKQFYQNKIKFICIGKKGYDFLKSKNFPILQSYTNEIDKPSFASTELIANEIISKYLRGDFDKIIIIYNKFKNAAVQQLVAEQFLPLAVKFKQEKPQKIGSLSYVNNYILEPGKVQILSDLVPLYLNTYFFNALLDSVASEHGARMTAMHKATDNATDLLRELTLHYNKARQATITKEILEIVGGAEALKG